MKNLQIRIIATLCILITLCWGCDSFIYNNLEDCPQGVYVKFYTKVICDEDSTYIGKTSSLTVFAFDENDKLVTTVEQKNVVITPEFEVLVPVSDGNYSFIAWAGINDKLKNKTLTHHSSTKDDVLVAINSINEEVAKLIASERIWHGESSMVFLPDPAEYGSFYEHTAINLKELTNRIRVIIEFEKDIMKEYDPEKLNVTISSPNGTVRIDGTTPKDSPILNYLSIETRLTENTVSWYYSTLALVAGSKNTLTISYDENEKSEIIFTGDLIENIILRSSGNNVDLNCDNDFTLRFYVKDYCADCPTHYSYDIYVNDWIVHSYSTDL